MAETKTKQSTSPGIKLAIAVAVIAIGGGWYFTSMRASKGSNMVTFPAQKGDLRVTVLEGGNVQAQESQEIKSDIKGREGTKILEVVEEGYLVTQEDVDNGLILVKLDPSALEDDVSNKDIQVQTYEATYLERVAQYEIQVNQNQRNISQALLDVKFARMDFEKFLGKVQVKEIVDLLDLENRFAEKPEEELEVPKPSIPKGASARPNAGSPNGRSGQWNRGGGSREGGQGRPGGAGGPSRGGPGGMGQMSPEQMKQMASRMKEMIEANGGEIPSMIKDRLPDMGMTEEQFMAMVNGEGPPPSFGGGGAQDPDPAADTSPPVIEVGIKLDAEYFRLRDSIDFADYADAATLEDGAAKQQLKTLESNALVAQEEARLALTRVEGQKRLFDKDFITINEYELEKVQEQRARIRVETARMDTDLYIHYTFPKDAEQFFFNYEEALMGLARARKEGEAKMAQESARLKSAERKFKLEQAELEDLENQLEHTTIRAERTGLVVYGSTGDSAPWRRNNEDPVVVGASMRFQQRIITIPDMTLMGIKVNIHESAVKKVAVGQPVAITIEAFPDRPLQGEVIKVAVLADSANAFMNPDLKVYPTVIQINGIYEWLKPGMGAEAEILIEALEDVLFIPIQAVTYEGDNQICFVIESGEPTRRVITLGSFNEEHIEITSGLSEGEEVWLLPAGIPQSDLFKFAPSERSPAPEPEMKDAV
jgi:multidrug resistance efflux pump